MFIVSIGLFIIVAMMMLKHFSTNLPDFIYGFIYGIAFAFELIGIFAMTQDVSKLRSIKMNLFKKSFLRNDLTTHKKRCELKSEFHCFFCVNI